MARNTLPRIHVTHRPGIGFQVTCTACPDLYTLRSNRIAADLTAREHQNDHSGAPNTLERLLAAHHTGEEVDA